MSKVALRFPLSSIAADGFNVQALRTAVPFRTQDRKRFVSRKNFVVSRKGRPGADQDSLVREMLD
jgi:hypothetical protein